MTSAVDTANAVLGQKPEGGDLVMVDGHAVPAPIAAMIAQLKHAWGAAQKDAATVREQLQSSESRVAWAGQQIESLKARHEKDKEILGGEILRLQQHLAEYENADDVEAVAVLEVIDGTSKS